MASGSITVWQIEREKMKVVTDFLFLGSKITVDGDCSISEDDCFLAGINDKPRQCVEKQGYYSADRSP